MKTKTLYYTFLTVLCSLTLLAQKAETPDFSYDIGGSINDMVITDGGTVVVASNDGLVGIKPGSNELLFKFIDYGKVKPEELIIIPNSPYLMVGQTGFGAITTKKAVIDFMSGQVLFSTEKNGWKMITTCNIVMPDNKLVVTGQRRASEKYANAYAIYDLNTGEQLAYNTFKGYSTITGQPYLSSETLILPTNKGLVKVGVQTGNIEWENDLKNVGWMVMEGNELYAFVGTPNGGNTKINKINANSGTPIWEDAKKVKGNVSNFEITDKGIAVVSDVDNSGKSGLAKLASGRSESKIAFLSAQTGDDLWEKAPKTKGYVQHFYVMDDGILFGLFEGGINKISFDGNTLFKKPLKTGEDILVMATTNKGLIYITSEDTNIVNLDTGDQVWSQPLKYKRAESVYHTFDENNNRFLIGADEVLYAVDATSGEVSTLAEFKFDGKELPSKVAVRDNGILLTSDQNMMLLNWSGNQAWHEYFRAPGKSAFGAILAGTLAVASAAASVSASIEANNHRNSIGQYTWKGEQYNDMANSLAMASGASIAEMLKRFSATSATEDAQFILTKLDEGVGLVKINKDSGAKEKEIILKDKKPNYQVDEWGGYLYYQANNSTVYAYDLKK